MDVEFLKNVSLFKELTKDELKYFATKLKHIKKKSGDLIIKENEEGNELFILYKGEVVVSKKMTMIDEDSQINKNIIRLTPKNYSFFGEIGLICSQKRTATVTATKDCEFFIIDHKKFMQICDEKPKIAIKVLMEIAKKLAKNLERTNTDVLKLTTALIYALK